MFDALMIPQAKHVNMQQHKIFIGTFNTNPLPLIKKDSRRV